VDPTGWLVLNFAVSCVFASGLGGLSAQYFGIRTPDGLKPFHTSEVLAADTLGDRSSLLGWSTGGIFVDVVC
jgi:ABC-type branched-subunit amino acid transport system permease subunit